MLNMEEYFCEQAKHGLMHDTWYRVLDWLSSNFQTMHQSSLWPCMTRQNVKHMKNEMRVKLCPFLLQVNCVEGPTTFTLN